MFGHFTTLCMKGLRLTLVKTVLNLRYYVAEKENASLTKRIFLSASITSVCRKTECKSNRPGLNKSLFEQKRLFIRAPDETLKVPGPKKFWIPWRMTQMRMSRKTSLELDLSCSHKKRISLLLVLF